LSNASHQLAFEAALVGWAVEAVDQEPPQSMFAGEAWCASGPVCPRAMPCARMRSDGPSTVSTFSSSSDGHDPSHPRPRRPPMFGGCGSDPRPITCNTVVHPRSQGASARAGHSRFVRWLPRPHRVAGVQPRAASGIRVIVLMTVRTFDVPRQPTSAGCTPSRQRRRSFFPPVNEGRVLDTDTLHALARRDQWPKPLVIVESPAKAKTISKFLGSRVRRARLGRPTSPTCRGKGTGPSIVDNGFKPTYELTERGKTVIKDLRILMKDASELYLATDEDRRGRSHQAWHLPRVPQAEDPREADGGSTEITKAAHRARRSPTPRGPRLRPGRCRRDSSHPRPSVRVTRSAPVLWRRVNRGLSAGRVAEAPRSASSSRRERETDRLRHRLATGTLELLTGTQPSFTRDARRPSTAAKVATGKDFGSTGTPEGPASSWSTRHMHGALTASPRRRPPSQLRSVEEKPYPQQPQGAVHDQHPAAGGRPEKLRLGAAQVMRVAPGSVRAWLHHLHAPTDKRRAQRRSAHCRGAARSERAYGQQFLSKAPAPVHDQDQERAGRPMRPIRSHHAAARAGSGLGRAQTRRELALYRMICNARSAFADGRRQPATTVSRCASLPRPAPSAGRAAQECEFAAERHHDHLRRLPPGVRRVHRRRRKPEEEKEALLPRAHRRSGRPPSPRSPRNGHATSPPARYTEAQHRQAPRRAGHRSTQHLGQHHPDGAGPRIRVGRKGPGAGADVDPRSPSSVCSRKHFDGLVDYAFHRARIEEDPGQDRAAASSRRTSGLDRFYFGDESDVALPGLKRLVTENLDEIGRPRRSTPFRSGSTRTGVEIVAKPGKYGPYVKRGDDTAQRFPRT